ncbi:probable cytochrome P450 6a23 [Eurosta solidaginis]|uniref:probable cytochrome P450 6a23 n=1 Tax=Eurosta solidaginis TaxID=178769 RepID=UPI0035307B57
MMHVFIALVAIIIGFVLYLVKYQQSYWERRGVPHTEPNFPWGDMKEWRTTKSLCHVLQPIYDKFKGTGPFCGIYFMMTPAAFVTDLGLVKKILIKDFQYFQDRGEFHNPEDDPLTGNIFQTDGPKWVYLRKKFSPTFTSGKMKYMFPTIVKVAHELMDVMEEQYTATDNIVHITNIIGRYTSDVIGSCAFGIECNSLRSPDAEFVVMGRKSFELRRHNYMIDSLMEAYPKLARKLHLRGLPDELHNFYMGIVHKAIEYRQKINIKRNDFMNLLLEMKRKDGSDVGLTDNDIAAQAFLFFLAGFETSSSAVSYALFEMAKNQEIQNKAREEVKIVIKEYNNEFTYEAIQKMKYMDRVFSETLRKYPILTTLKRFSKAAYDTGDPRYLIEKDMHITIPVHAIHHDPEYYPDPEKFDPERFTEEEIKKRPACSYLPFGDGPRNCIGARFGKLQSYTALAMLLNKYKFSFAPQTPENLTFAVHTLTLTAMGGVHLKIEKV